MINYDEHTRIILKQHKQMLNAWEKYQRKIDYLKVGYSIDKDYEKFKQECEDAHVIMKQEEMQSCYDYKEAFKRSENG